MKIVPDNKWLTKNSKELGNILENLPPSTFPPEDEEELENVTDVVELESSYTDGVNSVEIGNSIECLLIPSDTSKRNEKNMVNVSTLTNDLAIGETKADEEESLDWDEMETRINALIVLKEFKDASTNTKDDTKLKKSNPKIDYNMDFKEVGTNTDNDYKELEEEIQNLKNSNKSLREMKEKKNMMIEELQAKIEALEVRKTIPRNVDSASLISDLVTENENKDDEIKRLKREVQEKNEYLEILLKNDATKCSQCEKKDEKVLNGNKPLNVAEVEIESSDVPEKTEENNSEEEMDTYEVDIQSLVKNKHEGYRRTSPHGDPEKNSLFKCPSCIKVFSCKTTMKQHMNLCHIEESDWPQAEGEVTQTCKLCDKKFDSPLNAKRHMDTVHTEDGDWTCSKCEYQTNAVSNLQKHIQLKHTKNKCDQCGIQYGNLNELEEHKKDEHENRNKGQVPCHLCDNSFQNKLTFRLHMRDEHKTYKPCINLAKGKCEYDSDCMFSHDFNLNENERICYDCGFTTTLLRELMLHIKYTHGSRPCRKYKNNECSRNNCRFSHSPEKTPRFQREKASNRRFFQNPPEEWPNLPPVNQTLTEQMSNLIPLMMKKIMPEFMMQWKKK